MAKKYKKLEQLRLQKNMTYSYVAKHLKVSRVYYWQIENKKRKLYYETARKIAALFNSKPDEIFYDDYQEKKAI